MIIGTSIESLYKRYQKEIERFRLKHITPPVSAKNLELIEYVDKLGRHYYRFGKAMAMPIDRLGQLKNYTQYLSKGLSAEEDDLIDAGIRSALDEGISNNNSGAAAKIGALLVEREKKRKTMMRPLPCRTTHHHRQAAR